MKKLSLILASAVLFGGLSFAAPILKQDTKAPAAKQTTKPAAKPATKPATKPAVKPATKPAGTKTGKAVKKVPAKKAATTKKAAK